MHASRCQHAPRCHMHARNKQSFEMGWELPVLRVAGPDLHPTAQPPRSEAGTSFSVFVGQIPSNYHIQWGPGNLFYNTEACKSVGLDLW